MEEGLSPKGKTYQQDVFSWCAQGRLKLLDVMLVLKSHNTCTNQPASSIVFGCLSPSRCTGRSYKISKKTFDLRSLALRSVFCTLLICVSLRNCYLL